MVGVGFLAVVVVAAMLGLAVGTPVLTMGLVVPFGVVGPLALGAGALAAALGAVWVGNLLMPGRIRLVSVVVVAEASAVVLFLVMLGAVFLPGLRLGLLSGPLAYTAAVCAGGVAISASGDTVRLRGSRGLLGWAGAAALLVSAALLSLEVSVGGAGLLPLIPDLGLVTLGYESLAWICLVCLVGGASMAVLRSGRFSPGHALGRDAAATLALVAAIPLGVVGSISFACSNLVGCSGEAGRDGWRGILRF